MTEIRSHRRPAVEPELDDRKASILNAIVAEYIETAQPVGSGHVTAAPGIEVSSATVRSEMVALEREGYLMQPHTSAGRIPTDKGYRFFVDHLGRPGVLAAAERQEVRKFFAHVHGEVEDLLGRTSGLLADLTDYAAVVVGPTHETSTLRALQLVGLGSHTVLVLAVMADGSVEKRVTESAAEADDAELLEVSAHLTAALQGRVLSDVGAVTSTGSASSDALARLGIEALLSMQASQEPDHVFVGGSSRMAQAFDAVETVRSVLAILEQQLVVVELIEDILERGLSVAIGAEHGFEPLASCALVVSNVAVDGESAGTIGILGPTRMNYPKALAAVQIVGAKLSERLARARGESDRPGGGG
jgi:heat-inducible transcriptional repressor